MIQEFIERVPEQSPEREHYLRKVREDVRHDYSFDGAVMLDVINDLLKL